jgi:signal transduction histidine kinase
MSDEKPVTPQQEKLAALYEVSSRLSTTLDLGELLNLVMDSIIQLTGAERGYLVLFDEVTGELQVAAARNVDQETLAGGSMEISRTVVQRAATTGQPILTDNAQEDSRFSSHQSVIGYQLRSIMCTPLRARARIIGAAYVDNRLFSNVFSEEDLELLIAFANQAAMAIENARLFRQTDEALARRVEELSLFQRIDQELNRSLNLQRVLDLALDWALTLTGADTGSIGLLQEAEETANGEGDTAELLVTEVLPHAATDETVLRLLVYRGGDEANVQRVLPADHPILAQVLAEGDAVTTRHATAAESIDGTAAAAQLAVPIRREGTVVGLFTLESHQEGALSDEDIAFVKRLADRAAVAIENARLYEAVQAANKAKSEFVSLVTHELRVPLTSIRGYTDLLLGEMAGPISEPQREFLSTVKRNLDRMSVLIRDLSDINRIESGRMQFDMSAFDLLEVVEHVASDLQEAIEGREQTLQLDLPEMLPDVYGDQTRIAQVLTNLVSNAYKYTPQEGQITVRARREADAARVDVVDTGVGISEEDQERLFTQFFRSDDRLVREQTGWGLGLSIVKKMVELQGGEVGFSSELGRGSTFWFTLPLAAEGA